MQVTNTHMPFLARAPSGDRVFFFCKPLDSATEPVIWKLNVQCGELEPFRIETGLSEQTIECSPAAWHDETGWHLTFVAGGDPVHPTFHLYRMDGVSLQRLSPPVALKATRTGFVYRNRMVSGDKNGNVVVISPDNDFVLEFPKMELLRLSYFADDPEVILVSCRWPEEDEICTVVYDIRTCAQSFLEADGKPVYKPTCFDGELYHAERVGAGFEERRIRKAEKIAFVPCKMASIRMTVDAPLILPEIESEEQIRRSDLTSVEKHLGAAFVLASEIGNGHAYRMRFVGHLHEAEDESQSHPVLHRQIRRMRKNYQKSGTIPDWESLAKTLYEAMDDS